jgi:hypothetical protein
VSGRKGRRGLSVKGRGRKTRRKKRNGPKNRSNANSPSCGKRLETNANVDSKLTANASQRTSSSRPQAEESTKGGMLWEGNIYGFKLRIALKVAIGLDETVSD